jgi:ribosome-associated protein
MTEPKDTKSKGGQRVAGGARRRRGHADKSRAAMHDESRDLALVVARAALEKKAAAVEILDVVGKVDYADFLVLMTGRSARHVDALAQEIEAACERGKKKRALSVEGLPSAAWVLIDFGDVVVHVFQEQTRGLYDIEGLWLDAKRLPVPGETG